MCFADVCVKTLDQMNAADAIAAVIIVAALIIVGYGIANLVCKKVG